MSEEEANGPNNLGKALQEWWDSDACKKLQKANEEMTQRVIGKYFMLSESDKMDMVQAICYIICKAEKEGISHRGLQDALGIYPSGFWIPELMDVHNAIYTYYRDKRLEKELEEDIKKLQDSSNSEEIIKCLDNDVN
jgi:phosphomevalonate kinase